MKTLSLLLFVVLAGRLWADDAAPVVPKPLAQPPMGPGLVIKAAHQEVLLKSNCVYYSNNVIATYPPSKPGDPPAVLHSQTLTAYWAGRGKITNVVAHGLVQLDNGEKHARGEHAVYDSATERIVLTGAYSQEFPLPMLWSEGVTDSGTNYGTEIIYYRLLSKLVVTNAVTEVPERTLNSSSKSGTTNAPAKANEPKRILR